MTTGEDQNNTTTKTTVQFYNKEQIEAILATKGDSTKLNEVALAQGRTPKSVYQKYHKVNSDLKNGIEISYNKADAHKRNNKVNNQSPVIATSQAQELIQKAALREFKQAPTTPVQINGLTVRFPNNEFKIGDVKITW